MARSVSYDEYLIESLKDRRLAEAYLKAALEEKDPRVFLLALRNVAQARGMSKVAAKSKLNRVQNALQTRQPELAESGGAAEQLGFPVDCGIQGCGLSIARGRV